MKSKFTPGPWNFANDTEDVISGREVVAVNIFTPNAKLDGHIASVGALGMSKQEIEANAALISSAPCMLEALEAWSKYVHALAVMARDGKIESIDARGAIARGENLDELMDDAFARTCSALTKARGEK